MAFKDRLDELTVADWRRLLNLPCGNAMRGNCTGVQTGRTGYGWIRHKVDGERVAITRPEINGVVEKRYSKKFIKLIN